MDDADPAIDLDEISPEGARRAFHDHLIAKAGAARLKYGLYIDAEVITRMLDDPEVVRHPTSIHFDASPLQPHEFAYPQPLGFHPSDGFALCVHPAFRGQPENLPLVVAYHIPAINYGSVIDAEGAELYGATLLGLSPDAYYAALCELADSIGAVPAAAPPTPAPSAP
jgi:hypothetical protein